MDTGNNESLERIVDAAFENDGVAPSPADQADFARFRSMAVALKTPAFEAPEDVISRAKGIFGGELGRPPLARLVFSTMQPSAVRSLGSDSFQMVFEAEESRIRLMYSPENAGWEVLGQVESGAWTLIRDDREVLCDKAGRFAFFAKRLGDTGLTLQKEEMAFRIPSAEEVATLGPRRDD